MYSVFWHLLCQSTQQATMLDGWLGRHRVEHSNKNSRYR